MPETVYDLLGRPIQTVQYEASGGITTTQSYDGLGWVVSVSNPARSGDTPYSTTFTFDALERPLTATAPAAASATTFSYAPVSGYTAEGSQSRSFGWNMRGWLTSATNPEASTTTATTFRYDNNGNQVLRQDARGIGTCYAYDVANRPTSQSYYVSGGSCSSNNTSSPATPNVIYSYDSGAANANGRLVSISNAAAVDAVTGYDELGRVTGSSQTIGSAAARSFSYTYNLADALVQTMYPSGRA